MFCNYIPLGTLIKKHFKEITLSEGLDTGNLREHVDLTIFKMELE